MQRHAVSLVPYPATLADMPKPQALALRPFAAVFSACVIAGTLSPTTSTAQTNPDTTEDAWSFGIGVKSWVTRWATWQIGRASVDSGAVDIVSQLESNTRLAVVPVLTARYGRYFASTSLMANARYTLGSSTSAVSAKRQEFDVNAGIDLLANVSASLGYKRIVQEAGGRYVWGGPVLGLNANAPLGGALSMYGTVGLGVLKLDLPVADPTGRNDLSAQYALGEWGLAYRHEEASRNVFALGYRTQVVRTRDYGLGARDSLGNPTGLFGRETLRDVTEGLTASWVFSF
jgi:hypothetical protein